MFSMFNFRHSGGLARRNVVGSVKGDLAKFSAIQSRSAPARDARATCRVRLQDDDHFRPRILFRGCSPLSLVRKNSAFYRGAFGCDANRIERIHDRGDGEDAVYASDRLHHGRAQDAFVRVSG